MRNKTGLKPKELAELLDLMEMARMHRKLRATHMRLARKAERKVAEILAKRKGKP